MWRSPCVRRQTGVVSRWRRRAGVRVPHRAWPRRLACALRPSPAAACRGRGHLMKDKGRRGGGGKGQARARAAGGRQLAIVLHSRRCVRPRRKCGAARCPHCPAAQSALKRQTEEAAAVPLVRHWWWTSSTHSASQGPLTGLPPSSQPPPALQPCTRRVGAGVPQNRRTPLPRHPRRRASPARRPCSSGLRGVVAVAQMGFFLTPTPAASLSPAACRTIRGRLSPVRGTVAVAVASLPA